MQKTEARDSAFEAVCFAGIFLEAKLLYFKTVDSQTVIDEDAWIIWNLWETSICTLAYCVCVSSFRSYVFKLHRRIMEKLTNSKSCWCIISVRKDWIHPISLRKMTLAQIFPVFYTEEGNSFFRQLILTTASPIGWTVLVFFCFMFLLHKLARVALNCTPGFWRFLRSYVWRCVLSVNERIAPAVCLRDCYAHATPGSCRAVRAIRRPLA